MNKLTLPILILILGTTNYLIHPSHSTILFGYEFTGFIGSIILSFIGSWLVLGFLAMFNPNLITFKRASK